MGSTKTFRSEKFGVRHGRPTFSDQKILVRPMVDPQPTNDDKASVMESLLDFNERTTQTPFLSRDATRSSSATQLISPLHFLSTQQILWVSGQPWVRPKLFGPKSLGPTLVDQLFRTKHFWSIDGRPWVMGHPLTKNSLGQKGIKLLSRHR